MSPVLRVVARAFALGVAAVAVSAAPGATEGDAARGQQLFATKQCAHCHRAGTKLVGPPVEQLRRPQGAYELVGRFWNHAPMMFTALSREGLPWPTISVAEMADLMSYLQADASRDPAPDARKGLRVLVAKGCLKCHSLKGEGASVAPDLAERRVDYAPPEKWAATVWSHTPRIAAKAIERGIMYPRFTGDEMTHLISFLRGGDSAR
jgi:cytochrome c551/c552